MSRFRELIRRFHNAPYANQRDLPTTLRASGGSGGATAASIYNARLTNLAKDKLIAPVPIGPGRDGLPNEMR